DEHITSTTRASSCVKDSPPPLLRVAWTAPTRRPLAISGTHNAASGLPVEVEPVVIPASGLPAMIVRFSLTALAIGRGACSISTNGPTGNSLALIALTSSSRLVCSVLTKTAHDCASTRPGRNSSARATTSLASSDSCSLMAASKIDGVTAVSCICVTIPEEHSRTSSTGAHTDCVVPQFPQLHQGHGQQSKIFAREK